MLVFPLSVFDLCEGIKKNARSLNDDYDFNLFCCFPFLRTKCRGDEEVGRESFAALFIEMFECTRFILFLYCCCCCDDFDDDDDELLDDDEDDEEDEDDDVLDLVDDEDCSAFPGS